MLNRQGRSILGYIRRMGVIEERGVPIFESRLTPLIKDGTLRDDNALGAGIVEAPPLVTIRITKEDALLHVRTELTAFVLLDMDIGKRTKDTQVGDIWLDCWRMMVSCLLIWLISLHILHLFLPFLHAMKAPFIYFISSMNNFL